MFIVLEGAEFSGKTTLAKRLSEFLSSAGIPNEVFHMPDRPDNTCADDILTTIKKGKERITSSEGQLRARATEFFLYLAAISCYVPIIFESIKNRKIVICDRYFFSTMVYQDLLLYSSVYGSLTFAENNIKRLKTTASSMMELLFPIPDMLFFVECQDKEDLRRNFRARTGSEDGFDEQFDYNDNINKIYLERVLPGYNPTIINNSDITTSSDIIANKVMNRVTLLSK